MNYRHEDPKPAPRPDVVITLTADEASDLRAVLGGAHGGFVSLAERATRNRPSYYTPARDEATVTDMLQDLWSLLNKATR